MWKFSKQQDGEQHSSLYSYVAVRILRTYPHTIQVWGIASFIVVKVFPQPPT